MSFEQLRSACASSLNLSPDVSKNLFFYWKGRVALYAYLLALNLCDGDEVIIPGLTCVVVPNAIIYTGAKPIYADIRRETLTLDLQSVEKNISSRTKLIIIQNTFGLSADVIALVELAHERGITVIEDCAHGFGGFYQGKPNGTIADAAFFSTQWNKPFSTGLGGFLLVNNSDMALRVKYVNRALMRPSWKELLSIRSSMFAHSYILTDSNYFKMVKLFRLLSKYDLVTGSSSAEEMLSVIKPNAYFKAMSNLQVRVGVSGINTLPSVLKLRKKAALAYRNVLSSSNKWHVSTEHDENNSHLKFPVLVRNRVEFIKRAENARIRLSDWFISPIHPVTTHFDRWHLSIKDIPVASEVASKLLTINTEVTEPDRVCQFLKDNMDLLL